MGLMRRVESRVERSVGAVPRESAPAESRRDRPKRDSKYYVQPGELARKLVKEMEDHKVSHSAREVVCNAFTIFLCPEDFERLLDRRDEVADKLERHLAKHVRSKRYSVLGDITVDLVLDDDLPLGRFGIRAERPGPERSQVVSPPVQRANEISESRPHAGGAGGTRIIPPKDVASLDLARQVIVLKAGNRVREFNKGRIILGRARDADFRVDDPNVSRRHAVIFWEDGRIVVQDLESTNGTMVNGYPVTSTVLKSNDVLVIGDCRITVESR